jgi:AraC-like DNA-binding protein
MPRGQCTAEQVALHLGVHRRTLHRQLAREGAVFADLLSAIRRELGARYVRTGRRPLTEVAQQLGFADLSAFSRWYRSTYGVPASQDRRAAR